ncbi:GNAT family N-acetyltransferase [Micromonospora sp. NPDC053740]|uniref:GNAT family N-acetyltransferase n=1 Tax=Micromonospora sp. NPDC053740 TaxID=3155173 RepID=UPI003423DBE3
MAVTFTAHTGPSAAPLFPALTDLYAVVYAEPPYEEGPEQVARFRDGLPDEAARPGFTLVAAEHASTLIGAAYGWTMPAGRWWGRADQEPPDDLRDVDKFAVMEWLVHPTRRGEGVGAGLMRRLLADRPERVATLASNPLAPARRMYARAGWRPVAGSQMPDGTPMDLLILGLPAAPIQGG